MMSGKIDTAAQILTKLGLTNEEIKVYLVILRENGDTALAVSRMTKLARTKVYRILDNLIAKNFVVIRLGDRGSRYVAAPPESLSHIVAARENDLAELKEMMPMLQTSLREIAASKTDASSVLYYHGSDGIRQATYNSLKAKGELLTYEIGNMDSFMSHREAEKLRKQFVTNKILIRTLTNAVSMDGWTDVLEMVERYWEIRHIPPADKPFSFEILIYNDVYCMYRYKGSEAFCVEIHSAELADMQKQMFEYLWRGAKKFELVNKRGEIRLET